MAFYRLQPFGEWRGDFRMARLAAQVTNVMTRSKESDPVTKEEAFMPDWEAALDTAEAEAQISEGERVWQKVKNVFGGLAKRKTKPPTG